MKPKIQVEEKSNPKLKREEPETVTTERWRILRYREQARLRRQAMTWLLPMVAFLVVTTMLLYVLQGFGVCGFQLSEKTLNWLGAATVGEVVGVTAAVVNSLFR